MLVHALPKELPLRSVGRDDQHSTRRLWAGGVFLRQPQLSGLNDGERGGTSPGGALESAPSAWVPIEGVIGIRSSSLESEVCFMRRLGGALLDGLVVWCSSFVTASGSIDITASPGIVDEEEIRNLPSDVFEF